MFVVCSAGHVTFGRNARRIAVQHLRALHAGPLVVEDEDTPDDPQLPATQPGHAGGEEASTSGGKVVPPFAPAEPTANRTAMSQHAGICTGIKHDCSAWGEAGDHHCSVRGHAQLRLNRCRVDYERLKSSNASAGPDAASTSKEIRRLMRRMYGDPDQDYEDWQIVVLSDMSSGALPTPASVAGPGTCGWSVAFHLTVPHQSHTAMAVQLLSVDRAISSTLCALHVHRF